MYTFWLLDEYCRPPLCFTKGCCGLGAGAIQLMQMQADLKRQIEAGQMEEQGVEAYLEQRQELMIGNLWKLNVADIENTLSRVCQKVPTFNFLIAYPLFMRNHTRWHIRFYAKCRAIVIIFFQSIARVFVTIGTMNCDRHLLFLHACRHHHQFVCYVGFNQLDATSSL